MTPEYLLGEAFAEIYLEALPHEHQYIMDNYNAFHKMAHMYIRKIGGMKHLAEQAQLTGSPFLKNLYRAVDEASKKIIKDRNKKAAKALSEEEVKEMVSPKPSDEERAKLIKKIDSLGADELADLVNQKVVDVVNDERRKEKDAVELQTVMHNELNDDSLNTDAAASGSEELDDKTEMPQDEEGRDYEDSNKKDANRKALKEAYAKWDPMKEDFTYDPRNEQMSYFRALLRNVSEGMIMESVGGAKRRDPGELLKNPLNLNIFESYLREGKPVRKASSEPTPVNENTTIPEIDKERVYSEALAQYTLLECAHTMRLINVSSADVARQSKFLANEYIK
jgi:DNA-binding phage protein